VRGRLTQLAGVQVIARASAQQYRGTTKSPAQIARELGVRYLLTGTVRWAKAPGGGTGAALAASRVQVSPELVEVTPAGAAQSRWQESFDAELKDVFQVQGEIAGRAVAGMQVALGAPTGRAWRRCPWRPTRRATTCTCAAWPPRTAGRT
jgi:TolB-like protein